MMKNPTYRTLVFFSFVLGNFFLASFFFFLFTICPLFFLLLLLLNFLLDTGVLLFVEIQWGEGGSFLHTILHDLFYIFFSFFFLLFVVNQISFIIHHWP